MSLETLFIHTLRIRRQVPGTEDRYGNANLEDAAGAEELVRGRVDEAISSEDTTNRDLDRRGYLVFLPPGLDLEGIDVLEWVDAGDLELRLDGHPRHAWDSVGAHHLEADAFHVDG